jgi:hypothetical protein
MSLQLLPASSYTRSQTDSVRSRRLEVRSLNPIKQAEVILQRRKEGRSQKEIAEEFGYTEPHISHLRMLGIAPDNVKDMVESGQITRDDAVRAMRGQKRGEGTAIDIAEQRAIEREVTKLMKRRRR